MKKIGSTCEAPENIDLDIAADTGNIDGPKHEEEN